jgi:hypothetical protein
MPRIIWFALGAVAGVVYASRLIEQEHLDKPVGAIATSSEPHHDGPDGKVKMAAMIEERAAQISELIYTKGQAIADKLRATQKAPANEPMPAFDSRTSPFGQPAMVDTREVAALGGSYDSNLGLESNR